MTFVRLNNYILNTDRLITLELVDFGDKARIQFEIRAVVSGRKINYVSKLVSSKQEAKSDEEITQYIKIKDFWKQKEAENAMESYLAELNK